MRPIVRERIMRKYNYRCVQCGEQSNLHIDHIIPLCRGGSDDEDNKQVLCQKCNLKKGKGVDFGKYFKIGDNPEYILLDCDFDAILKNMKSSDFVAVLTYFLKENDKLFMVSE